MSVKLSEQEAKDIAKFMFDDESVAGSILDGEGSFENAGRHVSYEAPNPDESTIKAVHTISESFSSDEYANASFTLFLEFEDKFVSVSLSMPGYCDEEWDCFASGFEVGPIADLENEMDKTHRNVTRYMLGQLLSNLPSDKATNILMEEAVAAIEARMKSPQL